MRSIALLYPRPHRSRLHVGIERVGAAAEILKDMVAVGIGKIGDRLRIVRHLIGNAVVHHHRLAVGDGQHRLAVDVVAVNIAAIADEDAARVVDLFPVDGEALRQPEPAVQRQQGANVADGIAAAVAGDVVAATQRRSEDDDGILLHRRGGAVFSDALFAAAAGIECQVDLVDDRFRNGGQRRQRDMQEQHAELGDGEPLAEVLPVGADLEARLDRLGIEAGNALAGLHIEHTRPVEAGGARRGVAEAHLVDEMIFVVGALDRPRLRHHRKDQRGCHNFLLHRRCCGFARFVRPGHRRRRRRQ
ncbi:MAG: hypothetical protein U1E43_09590 [Rhodospirillales bacterium]